MAQKEGAGGLQFLPLPKPPVRKFFGIKTFKITLENPTTLELVVQPHPHPLILDIPFNSTGKVGGGNLLLKDDYDMHVKLDLSNQK